MASNSILTQLRSIQVLQHQIPAHGAIPNTSSQNKPLLIYRSAFSSAASAASIESHLSSINVVRPQWRYSMYPFSHFHSTSHEVLCVSAGKAKLCFGHEDNPKRVEEIVAAGDVIVIPAGVAHRLLDDLSGGEFEMVGSYPVDAPQWDMCYGKMGEEGKVAGIKHLGWFDKDPIYGEDGPALKV